MINRTYIRRLSAICSFLSFGIIVSGQSSTILIEAEGSFDSIALSWIPADGGEYFEDVALGGYILERVESTLSIVDSTALGDGEYDYTFDTTYLANTKQILYSESAPLRIRDSIWWARHAQDANGFADVIGKIYYDPELNLESNGLSPQSAAYEYVKYCFINHKSILPSMALGYVDKSVQPGSAYQYKLKSLTHPANEYTIFATSIDGTRNVNTDDFILESPEINIPTLSDRSVSIDEQLAILVSSKALGDSIILKWLPNDAHVFEAGLRQGYRILKYDREIWNEIQVVKPWTREEYDLRRSSTDTAFIASSMIVHGDFSNGEETAMSKTQAVQDRYAYGAYILELSQLASQAMGLRFADRIVDARQTYEYRIELMDTLYQSVRGQQSIVNEVVELPSPIGFHAQGEEYEITLYLDARQNSDFYTFYFIDRSDDGGNTWSQVHDKPILFAQTAGSEVDIFEYKDSVNVLYKDYIYRVRGMDSFGEKSDASRVTVQAIDLTPPNSPFVDSISYVENQGAVLRWSDAAVPDDWAGYTVQLGNDPNGEFVDVSETLAKGTDQYTYTEPIDSELSYFFRVKTFDKYDNSSYSIALQLPVVDSIPPSPPADLNGFIDENGYAYLNWSHSPEKDLSGYRVYFANDPDAEFSQLTKDIIDMNIYTDTVALNILDSDIYYRVESQDNQYNRSEFSEIIKLERPDIIPPVTPAMLPPISVFQGIELTWKTSSSNDVTNQFLYRRLLDSEGWEVIADLSPDIDSYLDSLVDYEVVYEYALQAKDDADLRSEMSLPLQGRRYYEKQIIPVINLLAKENGNKIQLTWDYVDQADEHLEGQDYRFQVYKSVDGEPIKRYLQLVSKDAVFEDDEVEAGIEYVYAIQVVYVSGKSSDLSEPILIEKQ